MVSRLSLLHASGIDDVKTIDVTSASLTLSMNEIKIFCRKLTFYNYSKTSSIHELSLYFIGLLLLCLFEIYILRSILKIS